MQGWSPSWPRPPTELSCVKVEVVVLGSPSLISLMVSVELTPSLPQPVKFPGWMMQGRACKQYSFRSYDIYFQCYAFWWKSFYLLMPKKQKTKKQKKTNVMKISKFALLWVVFKWHHGCEGVKATLKQFTSISGIPPKLPPTPTPPLLPSSLPHPLLPPPPPPPPNPPSSLVDVKQTEARGKEWEVSTRS